MRTIAAILLASLGCAAPAFAESGIASIYGNGDGYAWRCVARQLPGGGCEKMNPGALTAAHRTLAFGTRVVVTSQRTGRRVVVTINDRGPFIAGRIIDLTPAAARQLGFDGLVAVTVEPL